ncbi:MAG TPA: TilS substrate-binding domain-containing protein, partial [Pseudonocardiaceae bacterium]
RAWLLARGVPRLTDAQLRDVDALVDPDRRRGRGAVTLPGGLEVTRERGRLVLDPRAW